MADFKKYLQFGAIPSEIINQRTTSTTQALSSSFLNDFNDSAKKLNQLNGDQTRTREEKAVLFDKLNGSINKKLSSTLDQLKAHVDHLQNDYAQTVDLLLKDGDPIAKTQIALHLMSNKDQVSKLMATDIRFVQAANDYPAAMFGIENEHEFKQQQIEYLHKHSPELSDYKNEINRSERHASNLAKKADILRQGANTLTDAKALESRFELPPE